MKWRAFVRSIRAEAAATNPAPAPALTLRQRIGLTALGWLMGWGIAEFLCPGPRKPEVPE